MSRPVFLHYKRILVLLIFASVCSGCSARKSGCSAHRTSLPGGAELCNSGRRAEGIIAYQNALRADPNSECLLFNLAACAVDAGQMAVAKTALDKLASNGARSYGYFRASGEYFYKTDDLDQAFYFFTRATHIEEHGRDFHLLARIAHKQKKDGTQFWIKAIELYKLELSEDSENYGLWSDLGVAYSSIDRDQEAIEAFRKVLEIYPQHPKAQKYISVLEKKNRK